MTLRATALAILAILIASQSIPGYTGSVAASPVRSTQQAVEPTSDDDRWDNGFALASPASAPFTSVRSIAILGKDVYVGGRFASAGGVAVSGIARWDGETWSNVGGGVDYCRGVFCFPTVYALQVKGNELIAGGNFGSIGGVTANKVAKWDGSNWSAIGDGVVICDGSDCLTVQSLALSGDDIYAVGNVLTDLKEIGGTLKVEGFARWDGNSWSPVGGGVTGESVSASINTIAVNGSDIYIAGNFKTAGSTSANNIARWNGREWSALGSGVDGCTNSNPNIACSPYVATIAIHGSDVYAGGRFTTAGGAAASNIARWDGQNWHALGSGANGLVMKLAAYGDYVYAGGTFTEIDGVKANGIARFDGTNWSPVGSGVDGFVDVIEFSNEYMYAAGGFSAAGGKAAYNIARWSLSEPASDPSLPKIAGISVACKKLTILGEGFDEGAVLLLNGEPQKTRNDSQNPSSILIAKKAGRKLKQGDSLRVRNHDGKLSPEFVVAR
jgi:hypothetical protein